MVRQFDIGRLSVEAERKAGHQDEMVREFGTAPLLSKNNGSPGASKVAINAVKTVFGPATI
jgi:hypothetical protein